MVIIIVSLKKWSSGLLIAYNASNFFYSKSKNKKYWNSEDYGTYDGLLLGLGINRYFKLKRNNFIVVSAKANYVWNKKFTPYGGDYNYNIDIIDNNNYANFGFSIAYKGWFRKRIKSFLQFSIISTFR